MASDPIPVEDNVISFNDYKLTGANRSPVIINGTVDLRDMDNMIIDLTANGKLVQFMHSKQDDVTQIFGNGVADFDATVKGYGDVMTVRANATLLSGSNITYVMKNDISQLQKTVDENMVTFTDFNQHQNGQTILVTGKGSSATSIIVNIDVEKGAIINAYLSEDGQNRAVIDGTGRLKYTLDFAGRDKLGQVTCLTRNLTWMAPNGSRPVSPPMIKARAQ